MTGSPPIAGGLGVLAGLAGWVIVAGAAAGTPWDATTRAVVLVVGIGLAFFAARSLARVAPWLPPVGLIGAAMALVVAAPGALVDSPESGPFGYANATAAFYVQAAAGGVLLTAATSHRAARSVGLVTAILAAVVPLANGSIAGALLAAVVILGFAGWMRPGWGHGLVVTAGVCFCGVLIATLVVGARDSAADSDNRRVVLWHEAVTIVVEHPVIGAGPGQFAQESPTARRDRDARWAHHEFLELAAEAGLPALALALTAVVWGFRILMWAPPPQAAVGALALVAFTVHACVDYVAHFPAVPLATAAMVGAASVAGSHRPSTVPP